jgi:hypothetical protein
VHEEPAIRVVIPGPWERRHDLVARVRQEAPGYVIAGKFLKHVETDSELPIALAEHDPSVAESFRSLLYDSGIEQSTLDAIARYPRAVWLASSLGVSHASRLLSWSSALVAAGGYGVHVVSGCKVHHAGDWLSLARHHEEPDALWAAFVSLNRSPHGDSYFSSGMQHLGFPDATAPGYLPLQEAGDLLRAFQVHQVRNQPVIQEGQTFRGPSGDLRVGPGTCPFPAGHLQHNPYGVWALT